MFLNVSIEDGTVRCCLIPPLQQISVTIIIVNVHLLIACKYLNLGHSPIKIAY